MTGSIVGEDLVDGLMGILSRRGAHTDAADRAFEYVCDHRCRPIALDAAPQGVGP